MDRLLARLERRIGRYAIPNLILYVVGAMAIFWVLSVSRPDVVGRMVLDMDAVRRGQIWRLVTFLFIPPSSSSWMILISLYFTWWVGSSLEEHWGAFRFNVYYVVGAISTIVAASLAGPTTNVWLDSSLFLAFATIFPDVTILLFFILPIQVKWLGLAAAAWMGISLVREGWDTRASIAAALVNYALFFAGHWWQVLKQRNVVVRQTARREQMRSAPPPAFGRRTCAICGAREADGADIRVCSCEKCGGQARTLCLEHARNH